MIKFYLAVLFFLVSIHLAGQKKLNTTPVVTKQNLANPAGSNLTQASGCDTVNYPIPGSWTAVYYVAGTGGSDGFVTGNNLYGDQEKAAYFDVSASANTYLTKVWIAIAVANSNRSENLSKVVPFKIYDGTSGQPGALLTTVNKLLSELHTDAISGAYSELVFPTAVLLPISKKFFVSIDVSNLTWSTGGGYDSLAIYSNQIGASTAGGNGFGWEKNNDLWATIGTGWGVDLSLIIHPFVSINSTCSVILPITLSRFTGKQSKSNNSLRWSTASEQDNAGFELQRSEDNNHFELLSFIPTRARDGNSTTSLDYIFTDYHPLPTTNYYRLKQVAKNGKFTFSSTIILDGLQSTGLEMTGAYPIPAKSMINITLFSPASDKVTLTITDVSGKMVLKSDARLLIGKNKISLDIAFLGSGSYMINASSHNNGSFVTSKFIKH